MRALLSIFLCCRLLVIATQGATLAGQSDRGGVTVEIRFPVAKSFQDIAAQGGNPRPDLGRALLTFPVNFDPARNWRFLSLPRQATSTALVRWMPNGTVGLLWQKDGFSWLRMRRSNLDSTRRNGASRCWQRRLNPCAGNGRSRPNGR